MGSVVIPKKVTNQPVNVFRGIRRSSVIGVCKEILPASSFVYHHSDKISHSISSLYITGLGTRPADVSVACGRTVSDPRDNLH